MTPEQAFGNLVACAAVAQKTGQLDLDQAAAVLESIKVVRKALGIAEPAKKAE